MAAQDDSDMRTDTEIKEDAMKALTEVLGSDKDGNLTKRRATFTKATPTPQGNNRGAILVIDRAL